MKQTRHLSVTVETPFVDIISTDGVSIAKVPRYITRAEEKRQRRRAYRHGQSSEWKRARRRRYFANLRARRRPVARYKCEVDYGNPNNLPAYTLISLK